MKVKKKFLFWSLFLMMFMLSCGKVRAASILVTPKCSFDAGRPEESTGTETCEIYVQADSGASCNNIVINAVLTNLKLDSHEDEENWTFTDNGNGTYTLKYLGNSLPTSETKITKLTFTKEVRADKCYLNLNNPSCTLNKTTCKQVGNTYYGKNGEVISADQFDLDCKEHKCEVVQNHYFGPNGNEITESQYKIDCDHATCTKLPDGRYLDKSGLVVPYIDYRKSCETIKCEVLPDGTRYDDTGKQVDEDEFREKCGDVCYQDSTGKYHGKSGEEVDALTYQKECGNNICQAYPDGTYSDPEGKETTKENYELKCLKHSCEKIGDIYFDKDGNETTKEDYELKCQKYSCEKVGDTFYDKDGNIVTEKEFNKVCPSEENPKTGANIPLVTLGIASVVGVSLIIYAKKNKKFV